MGFADRAVRGIVVLGSTVPGVLPVLVAFPLLAGDVGCPRQTAPALLVPREHARPGRTASPDVRARAVLPPPCSLCPWHGPSCRGRASSAAPGRRGGRGGCRSRDRSTMPRGSPGPHAEAVPLVTPRPHAVNELPRATRRPGPPGGAAGIPGEKGPRRTVRGRGVPPGTGSRCPRASRPARSDALQGSSGDPVGSRGPGTVGVSWTRAMTRPAHACDGVCGRCAGGRRPPGSSSSPAEVSAR